MRTGARGSVVMSMGCAGMAWHIAGYGYVASTAICGRLGVATVACSVTYSGIAYNSAYTLMNVARLEIEAQSRMLEYVTLHNLWWFTIIGRVWRNGVSAYMAQSGDYGHDAAICVHD